MDRHRSDEDDYGYRDAGDYPDQQPGGSGDQAGAQGNDNQGHGEPGDYGYQDPGGYPDEQPGGSGDG